MIRLSDRINALQPSATFAIKAHAAELRASGREIVDLSVGEPSGDPPVEATKAGIDAIRQGRNRYTPVAGLPELRRAIADHYIAQGFDCGPANVMVTMGAKQALYNLAMALYQPGDEVIVFSPYWVSYLPQLQLAGAAPVVVPTLPEDGFQPDIDRVAAAITPRTRGILINSPSNPSGCVVERSRQAALAELARKHDLVVQSDEIYGAFTWEGHEHTCFPTLSDDAHGRTVVLGAVSKSHAMTGWRVGWMVGPEPVIKACCRLQGHSTSGVCAVNQAAAVAAVRAPASYHPPIRAGLDKRRHHMADRLADLPGIELGPLPGGSFYAFPAVDGLFGRTTPEGAVLGSAMDVADFLLMTAGVAVVPGEAFGEPRCVRICYALDWPILDQGLDRIQAALASLS
jgi:aspartate aminotransferase